MADFDADGMEKLQMSSSVHPKRPLCACTSYSCNKLFLFLHTCTYVVVGAALLIIGVWVEFQNKDYESANNFLFVPALAMIAAGLVSMIISLFGVAGTVRENRCLLIFFLVATVLVFCTQVFIGVLAFIHRQQVPEIGSKNFSHLIESYHDYNHYRSTVDNIQASFECCGFSSYRDYENNPMYKCGSFMAQDCGVPWSCCIPTTLDGKSRADCGYGARVNSTMREGKIHPNGCAAKYLDWLTWNLDFVGIVGLGTAIPQIVGMLLAYFFIRQVREMKRWFRVGM